MSGYGLKENFDLVIIDVETNETLYSIHDSCDFKITRSSGATYVSFSKGTIDLEMTNAFLSGKHDSDTFKIIGNTYIRGENHLDYYLQLYVEDATFASYGFNSSFDSPANPVLKFRVATGAENLFKVIGEVESIWNK